MSAAHTIRDFSDLRNRFAFVGLALLVVSLAGLLSNSSEQFLRSWLVALFYVSMLPLGCQGLLMLHHMVGGQWGVAIRRHLEAGSRTMPVLILLVLPVLLNLPKLYEWAQPEHVAHDPLLQHKAAWLNTGFFGLRLAIYLAIWILFSYLLNKNSAEQDADPNGEAKKRLYNLSGIGLVIHVLTLTFAAFDLWMSIEPHWFSTMYGLLYVVGGTLATWAFVIVALRFTHQQEPLAHLIKPNHFADIGTLMFAFTVLWAYVNFSQFLIIWSGNIPEETPWYIKRGGGIWGILSVALMAFHFAVPFFLLLLRFNKRRIAILSGIAFFMLFMRLVDVIWLVSPAFHEVEEAHHVSVALTDFSLPLALAGLWAGLFFWQLGRRPFEPVEGWKLAGGHH